MKNSKYKLIVFINQTAISLHDKLGPFSEAVACACIGLVFLAICIYNKIGHLSEWAGFFAAFCVTSITVYLIRNATRKQEILVEVTLSYLIHGGKLFLDHLLGKLIGGIWRKEELRPGNALFDILDAISKKNEWEMKRRIVEALPALGSINTKRSLTIASILREDWEPTRWKADLRRRTIEALTIPAKEGKIPLMDRVKPEEVISFLRLKEKDQVFTAMAIAEALNRLEDTHKELAANLQNELLTLSKKMFYEDESKGIEELMDILKMSRTADLISLANRLEIMSKSPNEYIRTAAARNILLLGDRFPEKTLQLMYDLLNTSVSKYARRPIARERSVKFLIKKLSDTSFAPRAQQILIKLLTDTDDIIRITTFDMAELLRGEHQELLLKICNDIIINEPVEILRERAQQMKDQLS